MSRKYRQRGYQDTGSKSEARRPASKQRFREGPRSPQMPGLQTVVKCANCGARVRTALDEIGYGSTCPNCSSDLHSCKNCVHFNPASRFECTQPIPERISPKDERADCAFFEIKTLVEKITSSSASSAASPDNARDAFENLFKK